MLEIQLQRFGAVPFSHGALLPLLAGYRRPNDKIAEWVRQGVLLPLKRGMYVVGDAWRKGALCLPLVANHLYGPSCVSLDYALAWHGLIPERAHEVTSVCMRRGRVVDNVLGRFSYARLPAAVYALGIEQASVSEQDRFLLAGPAKALCDKVLLTRYLRVSSRAGVQRLLFEDLRVDESTLVGLDLAVVRGYAAAGVKMAQMQALLQVLEELR
jgi:hypothetical protein